MKTFKDYIQIGIIIILSGIIVWQVLFPKPEKDPDIKPIYITIPAQEGGGSKVIETLKPVVVTVPSKGEIIVDETYKKLYEEALEKERQDLYYQAIEIKETYDTIIKDENQIVYGTMKTRGDLLSYDFKYEWFEKQIQQEPVIIKQRPSLSMSVEAKAGVPTKPDVGFIMYGGIGVENKNGLGFTVGADTQERVWGGIRKSFKIKK